MNEQQYHQIVDMLFLKIEAWLEESDPEIDFDTQEGILTISFPDAYDIVLSRQPALQEIWLASTQGAFHFQYHQGSWLSKRQQSLVQILAENAKQAGFNLDTTKIKI